MPNTSTFTQDMGIFIAKQIKSAISERANVYLAISRVEPFSDDANPPVANSSVSSVINFWRNMIGGKKISGSDVSLVIPRKDWQNNNVVSAYTDTRARIMPGNVAGGTILANSFYVMTEDYNVYKCLFNNKGANSIVKPISTNPNTIYSTADGYVWKYMYTLSSQDRVKFLTPDWIPVRTLTGNDGSLQWRVQQAAVDGAIYVCTIDNPGSGYSVSNPPILRFTGDGTGASANVLVNSITTGIDSVLMTSYGSGYSFANVVIDSGSGIGAIIKPQISPSGGHGSDAESELGGYYIMLNPRLKGTENGKLPQTNDYRSYAILVDPKYYSGGNSFYGSAFSQTTDLTLTSAPSYLQDETVFQGISISAATFKGKLVTYAESPSNTIKLINPEGTPGAFPLTGDGSAASGFVNAIKFPDLKYYSGKIIFLDNISPVVRSVSQTEDVKIVVSCQLF